MVDRILLGLGRHMVPIPPMVWRRVVRPEADLDFMSEAHHRIRNFVVLELPRAGKPLAPEFIAQELSLSLDQVVALLDELEKHMTFLYRNQQGEVVWAYPVTVEKTPHHVTFSTGEKVYSA